MRHRFRLAQLLKYRKLIEDQRRIALTIIREKQYREKEKLSQLRELQRAYQRRLRGEQGETSLQLLCLDALSRESLSRRESLRELQREAARAREELLESSKDRKKVEKLRDRELKRYREHLMREEWKYLDEIATVRFARTDSPR